MITGISYTTITTSEYILRCFFFFFFCKYPMQLHCKQSADMLSMYMCLITTHSERERAGGKT